MAIDIRLSGMEIALQLHDDALYWFLHPHLGTLAERTGQYIDLYGDATFNPTAFPELRRTLAEARADAEGRTATWEVLVATQTSPVPRELYQSLSRSEVLAFLDRWEALVAAAQPRGCSIVCTGD